MATLPCFTCHFQGFGGRKKPHLGGPELVEALLCAAEAQGVEEAQRRHRARLRGAIEGAPRHPRPATERGARRRPRLGARGELRHGSVAGVELGAHDAQEGEHGEAAVVQLAVASATSEMPSGGLLFKALWAARCLTSVGYRPRRCP